MKKVLLKMISMLLCLLMLVSAFGGCSMIRRANIKNSDIFRMEGFNLFGDKNYEVGSFSYEAEGVRKVVVNWVNGSVELVQSAGKTLSVSESGSDLQEHQKLRWKLEGGTLKINYCKSGLNVTDIAAEKKQLRLELPAGVELSVNTVSAPVSAESLELEKFEINTVSGAVGIGVSTVGGSFVFQSVSGALKAEVIDAGSVRLETVSGGMSVERTGASGELKAESVSGAVSLKRVGAEKIGVNTMSGNVSIGVAACWELKADAVSASIEITLLEGLGASVSFSTVSGELNSDVAHTTQNGREVFGDGACAVKVETVSGGLTVG